MQPASLRPGRRRCPVHPSTPNQRVRRIRPPGSATPALTKIAPEFRDLPPAFRLRHRHGQFHIALVLRLGQRFNALGEPGQEFQPTILVFHDR